MEWNDFLGENIDRFAKLQKEIPDSFDGFNKMGKAAKTPGALEEKTKEFVALGIAISTRCESCIGFHVRSLVRLGATRAEFCEVLAMSCYMGGGPAMSYSAKALDAYDEFSGQ